MESTNITVQNFTNSREYIRKTSFFPMLLCVMVFSLIFLPALIFICYPPKDSLPSAEKNFNLFPFFAISKEEKVTVQKKIDMVVSQTPSEVTTPPTPLIISKENLLVPSIQVYRTKTGKTENIPFEEYVMGVVACEMPSSFPMEALKAQAVAARTYSLSKIIRSAGSGNPSHKTAPLCDATHCQVYKNPQELEKSNSSEWMNSGWIRVQEAVKATDSQLMFYQGALVEQALFHSSSGGKTQNSEDVFVSAVPYLRSVDSPFEGESPHTAATKEVDLSKYSGKIDTASMNKDTVKVLERGEGGVVEQLQLGNMYMTGKEARAMFALPSSNFDVSLKEGILIFTTYGYGHGVGLSQWGASGMAKEGYDYKKILSHYYSGIEVL